MQGRLCQSDDYRKKTSWKIDHHSVILTDELSTILLQQVNRTKQIVKDDRKQMQKLSAAILSIKIYSNFLYLIETIKFQGLHCMEKTVWTRLLNKQINISFHFRFIKTRNRSKFLPFKARRGSDGASILNPEPLYHGYVYSAIAHHKSKMSDKIQRIILK